MISKTRPLMNCDNLLSYAIRYWAATKMLTFASYLAKATGEEGVEISSLVQQTYSSAASVSEILSEESKSISEKVHSLSKLNHGSTLSEFSHKAEILLCDVHVLTVRAALFHEALLVIPENHPIRHTIRKASEEIDQHVDKIKSSLEDLNELFTPVTFQAIAALAMVEYEVSFEEAEKIVNTRWM